MSRKDLIEQTLKDEFQPELLEVIDESHQHSGRGIGTHFRVVMVSNLLKDLSRVEREQKVQSLFTQERTKGLHALSVRLYTSLEWDKLRSPPEGSPTCVGQKVQKS